MKKFKSRPKDVDEDAEEGILEFEVAGEVFQAHKPRDGQAALLLASGHRKARASDQMAAVLEFLDKTLLDDGPDRIRDLLSDGVIDVDDLIGGNEFNDEGIIDWMFGQVDERRPTKPSTGSSGSQRNGGRKSTGRSRGPGSIR